VNSAASRDTLSRAFARLVEAPPGADYSAETQEARSQLLRAALDCLTDGGTRRLYDQRLVSGAAEVCARGSIPLRPWPPRACMSPEAPSESGVSWNQ